MNDIMTVRLHEVGKVSAVVKDAVVVEKDVPGVGVPPGGASGQVLTKLSGADYDTGWRAAIGGGENDHSKLTNRDAQDQHPIGAIAGLAEALDGKQPKGDYLTADTLQDATDAALAQAKDSGAFDGAPGAPGEKGDKGDTGPAGPQGPAGAPGKDAATDISLGITGATVGQIAKITAVDETGKPTAWSPVDMPSGGGIPEVSWHAWDNVIVPEGGLNAFDFTMLASGEKLSEHQVKGMFIYSPSAVSSVENDQSATLIVNGDYAFNLMTFSRSTTGYLRILLTVENGQLVVRYYKRDTDNRITFPATTVTINLEDLHSIENLIKSSTTVIGYGKTLKLFNRIESVRIESSGQVAKDVEFDVQVLY